MFGWHIVYDLRTQNLNFVATIPEQIGTTIMHFPNIKWQETYISGGFVVVVLWWCWVVLAWGQPTWILRVIQISDHRLICIMYFCEPVPPLTTMMIIIDNPLPMFLTIKAMCGSQNPTLINQGSTTVCSNYFILEMNYWATFPDVYYQKHC